MDYAPDLLAVLVASLVPMFVGALWYGPVFGKLWMELVGKTEEELKAQFNPVKSYGVTFVVGFIAAYTLAHVLNAWDVAFGATGWAYGMQGAFWCWIGFVVWVTWQQVAFEDKPVKLWILNIMYNLATLLGMGAILGVWR